MRCDRSLMKKKRKREVTSFIAPCWASKILDRASKERYDVRISQMRIDESSVGGCRP